MANGHGGARPGAGAAGAHIASYRRMLIEKSVMEWTSEEEVKTFWRNLVKAAQRGDTNAAKLIMPYLFGALPTESKVSMEVTQNRPQVDLRSLSDEELSVLDTLVKKSKVKETSLQ